MPKAKLVLVKARHTSRLDRNKKPIEKSFPQDAWDSLHDPEWVLAGESKGVPAPLKAKDVKTKAVKAAPVRAPKKLAVKKSVSKPTALKAKSSKK